MSAHWPLVQEYLPRRPSTALEIGCGSLGGFVPSLLSAGHDALGVDPLAPETASYECIDFEAFESVRQFDVIIACLCLHHVSDLVATLDKAVGLLAPEGALVVVDWAWERLDEKTRRWCADHLECSTASWLGTLMDEWQGSHRPWQTHLSDWATRECLHRGTEMLRLLDERFECLRTQDGPHLFRDLVGVSEASERSAIDAGVISPLGFRYVGRLPDVERRSTASA